MCHVFFIGGVMGLSERRLFTTMTTLAFITNDCLTRADILTHAVDEMTEVLQTIQDVELRPSPINGTGLFTTRDRSKGEILAVLDGQVVPHGNDLDFLLAHEWNAISDEEILLRPVWTLYGYINHARPGLLTFSLIHRTLSLRQDVISGTELTLNYLEHGMPEVYMASPHGQYLR